MFQAYILLLLYDSALQISQIQLVCFYYFPAPVQTFPFVPLTLYSIFQLLTYIEILQQNHPQS